MGLDPAEYHIAEGIDMRSLKFIIASAVFASCLVMTSCSQYQPVTSANAGLHEDSQVNATTAKSAILTQVMKVNAKQLGVYAQADSESAVVKALKRDDKLTVITNSDETDFYPVINEQEAIIGYVEKARVVDENAALYARIPYTKTVMKNKDGTTPTKDHLVDVREYTDDIETFMILAYDDNFSGKPFYERDLCLLQKDTLDKLLAAQEKFKKDGYRIKIYDAYRPQYVQEEMFKIVNNLLYIANPKKASDHVRGTAVDMTLVDEQGNELEMPTPMHTFNATASIYSKKMSDTARKNMKYMQNIMLNSGFVLYSGEWWHFKDSDFEQYNITSHHFDDIEMVESDKAEL